MGGNCKIGGVCVVGWVIGDGGVGIFMRVGVGGESVCCDVGERLGDMDWLGYFVRVMVGKKRFEV